MIGANALFTDVNRPLQWEFEYMAEKIYRSAILPVNFMNPSSTVSIINRWVANITHNRIAQLVQEGIITRLLFYALNLFVMMYLFLYVAILSVF
jgi:serine protease inhibitor